MEELIIPPTQLTLVATNKCTSACQNCCFQCNPQNKDRLTLTEMKQYITQSVETYNSIKLLIISGGECFTLGKDLDRVIKFATDKGLSTRVVTNGYWAKSPEKSYQRVKSLVEAGLTEINFSTGDEHLIWVPYDNIVYAVTSSLELDLTTVVNVETSKLSHFTPNQLKTDSRLEKYQHLLGKKLFIFGGIWIPFLKSTETQLNTLKNEKRDTPSITIQKKENRCSSLFNTISIDPNHQVNVCCGLTIQYNSYLRLGSAQKYPLKYLYEYQFQDFLKIWLFTEGPRKILNFCRNKREMPPIDTSKWHLCQICLEIFRDEQNILTLRQNYSEIFPSIMLKYSLLKEKYFKIFKFNSNENK